MCKWEARERDRNADNLSRLIYFSVSFRQLSRQQQLKRGENVDKRKEKAEKKYNWKKWRCRCSAEMNVFLYSHRFVHTLHSYYCTSGPDSGKTPFIVYGFFFSFLFRCGKFWETFWCYKNISLQNTWNNRKSVLCIYLY